MPIEYDRGVEGTRVTLAFEIQEAISFRNAVAAALADVSPELLARDPAATRELTTIIAALGRTLDAAVAGRAESAEAVRGRTDRALGLIDDLYPDSWKEAATGADFDVIAASIDRLAAAAKAGSWSRAEQARLEAYAIFESGPEKRLLGFAPPSSQQVEGLFWQGSGSQQGLSVLIAQGNVDQQRDPGTGRGTEGGARARSAPARLGRRPGAMILMPPPSSSARDWKRY